MLAHVLIPLDGSPLAESALEYALKLVKPDGKITLLSVIQIPEYPVYDLYPIPATIPSYDMTFDQLLPGAKTYLEKIAENLKVTTDLEVEIKIETGDPAALICDTADEIGAETIVMSTHGRSGLGRWFFGSVTSKVLMGTHCPVLVVPQKGKKQRTGETPAVEKIVQ
jgi:nucleotide-binding universal stress UspA family protein